MYAPDFFKVFYVSHKKDPPYCPLPLFCLLLPLTFVALKPFPEGITLFCQAFLASLDHLTFVPPLPLKPFVNPATLVPFPEGEGDGLKR